MGEMVRLALLRFIDEGLLFNGIGSEQLRKKGEFLTKYISKIELDEFSNYKNCLDVLHRLGIYNITYKDCANVRYICECVSRRSAHLASAGITTLINKMNEPSVTVSKHQTYKGKQIVKILSGHALGRCRWIGVSLSSEIS